MIISRRVGWSEFKPRGESYLGWFNTYDGNIIGGLMLGSGMALTGSCPHSIFVQVGAGRCSSFSILGGCVLGGIAYVAYGPKNKASTKKGKDLALFGLFNIGEGIAIFIYELACFLTAILLRQWTVDDTSYNLNPIFGGILIGGAQTACLALTGNSLGISGSFEQMGKFSWRLWNLVCGRGNSGDSLPAYGSIVLGLGITIGSLLFSTVAHTTADVPSDCISSVRAVTGGFVMVFGSRVAGGCTSGHGISGSSALSISSFVTVISMYAGGIVVSKFFS